MDFDFNLDIEHEDDGAANRQEQTTGGPWQKPTGNAPEGSTAQPEDGPSADTPESAQPLDPQVAADVLAHWSSDASAPPAGADEAPAARRGEPPGAAPRAIPHSKTRLQRHAPDSGAAPPPDKSQPESAPATSSPPPAAGQAVLTKEQQPWDAVIRTATDLPTVRAAFSKCWQIELPTPSRGRDWDVPTLRAIHLRLLTVAAHIRDLDKKGSLSLRRSTSNGYSFAGGSGQHHDIAIADGHVVGSYLEAKAKAGDTIIRLSRDAPFIAGDSIVLGPQSPQALQAAPPTAAHGSQASGSAAAGAPQPGVYTLVQSLSPETAKGSSKGNRKGSGWVDPTLANSVPWKISPALAADWRAGTAVLPMRAEPAIRSLGSAAKKGDKQINIKHSEPLDPHTEISIDGSQGIEQIKVFKASASGGGRYILKSGLLFDHNKGDTIIIQNSTATRESESIIAGSLLHEIGHAVDKAHPAIGKNYKGLANWQEGDRVDLWIDNFGAGIWKGTIEVSQSDRGTVKNLIEACLHGKKTWSDLVPAQAASPPPQNTYDSGAAIASAQASVGQAKQEPGSIVLGKYLGAGIPIIELAERCLRNDQFYLDESWRLLGWSYLYIANRYYKKFFICSSSVGSEPGMRYAAYAPDEYFAESYQAYYLSDGPGKSPGGSLNSDRKDFFDKNVNKIGIAPGTPQQNDGTHP